MAAQVKIWVQLMDYRGNQLASATEISLKTDDTIDYLLEQVKSKYPAQLWCLEPNQLRAFPSEASFKAKSQPLRARDRVNNVLLAGGRPRDDETEEPEPIAVLVPINSSSEKWSTTFLTTSIWSMPALGDLSQYLQQELPLKIDVMAFMGPRCGVGTMFNINDSAPCEEFNAQVLGPITYGSSLWSESESAYISTWNIKISSVFSFALSDTVLLRYWNHSTSDLLHWPSFLLKWDSVNILRGEELVPLGNVQIGRERLHGQMLWIFGDEVPYLFGYTASGNKIQLFALVQSEEDPLAVESVQLSSYGISCDQDTFRLMLALLNIGRLVQCLAKLCSESVRREYVVKTRADGVILRMTPKYVLKDYSKTGMFARAAQHLTMVNDVLTSERVPNVEILVKVKKSVQTLVFKPRGDCVRPRDLLELFDMLLTVLETLEVLHEAGWTHRNIHWDSICKHFSSDQDSTSWFVTNFDFAEESSLQNPTNRLLAKGEGPPELLLPGGTHTSAVDLWSLGHLIRDSQVGWDDEAERTAFADSLLANDPFERPSASEALKQLLSLNASHRSELQQLRLKHQQVTDQMNGQIHDQLKELEEKRLEKEKRQGELEKKRLEDQHQLEKERLKKRRRKHRKLMSEKKKKQAKASNS